MDLLRHLRFFTAVAQARHFGQAASDLGMTQPPLSQGVQRLERRLGVRLFDRDARGVRITDAGRALLPRAEALLAEADGLLEEAATWSAEPVLRLGVAVDLDELVGQVVSAAAAAGVPVQPLVAGSTDLVDRIKDGEIDLAVVRHPGVVDGTLAGPVATVPTRLLGRLPEGAVRLRDVAVPLVVPPRRHQPAAHDQLEDVLRRAGHRAGTVQERDPLTVRALVAAGQAVALTTSAVAGSALAGDPLPLRVRVLQPVPGTRRPGIDHERVAALVEAVLG